MRVCPAWRVCTAALLTAWSAASASAQTSPILPETRVIQRGPVSLYPNFAVRDAGIDSNVYIDPTDPKSDFTYSAASRLFAVLPIGHTRFIGTGEGNFLYFQTYKDQQSLSGNVEGRYEVTGPGFRPFAEAGFADRRERRGYEIDARVRQRQTMASVGAELDVTPRTALTTWVRRVQAGWAPDAQYLGVSLSEQLDYRTLLFAGGARFRATPLTTISFTAEGQRDRFDRVALRDADRLLIGPSVNIDSPAAIVGTAKVGYQWFNARDPIVADYQGVAASASIRYRFRDLTEIRWEMNRNVDYSFDAIQPYYLESDGALVLSQRVFGPIEALAIGERRDLRHQRVGAVLFDGRHETTHTVGTGFALHLSKQMRFELTYQRTNRTSSDISREYERRRILGSISYGL